jgi:ABC-type nitrate/sulfonate/bicarbonate transport system substrate-binding protein
VIPWTRVAAAEKNEAPLKLLCGSGCEEAALVVRKGLDPANVRSVAIPREGGMKDLTAMGLIDSMGWQDARQMRFPSGDGAIIAFFGRGADAASMVEPYATMMEQLGVGTVVRRTGDIWPGAPGCSLTASAGFIAREPDVVQRVVTAFVRGARSVLEDSAGAAEAAAPYIGVAPEFIAASLRHNRPVIDAIRNTETMNTILHFMRALGYIDRLPSDFTDLRFLDRVASLAPV